MASNHVVVFAVATVIMAFLVLKLSKFSGSTVMVATSKFKKSKCRATEPQQ